MKVRSHRLSPSVARGIAVLCAAVIVSNARSTAVAGINVWTSHGPEAEAFNAGNGGTVALVVDPNTPTTLYAAVDAPHYNGEGGFYYIGSIFKSTDGGNTWEAANAGLPNPDRLAPINALAIDPSTPSTLYAATDVGLFKSTDGADTWSAANTGLSPSSGLPSVTALAIDPSTPTTLYAGTGSCLVLAGLCGGAGVFKSTDAGNTWGAGNTGFAGNAYITALAIDSQTPSTLYAATFWSFGDFDGGAVFKSTDGADTWSAANTGLSDQPVAALAIDFKTPSTLYASVNGYLFKSTDSAGSWQRASAGLDGNVLTLALDPNTPSTLYAATDGPVVNRPGLFKSTDGASSWAAFKPGLPGNPRVHALAIDPSMSSTLYAGTYGGDVFSIEQAAVVGTGTAASCTDAALNAALAGGGLVTFDCGPAPVTIDISGTKTIGADTTLDGGGLIGISGISREDTLAMFRVNAGVNFTVKHLTIAYGGVSCENGAFCLSGVAIMNAGGLLTVTDSTFTDNPKGFENVGGIENSGTVTVDNSTFSGMTDGIENRGTATVTNSTFTDNNHCITNDSGTVTVTNSTFTGTVGDCIQNLGMVTVTNSTFTVNPSDCIHNGGTLTVANSTFTGNSTYNSGATVPNYGNSAVLRNLIGGSLAVANSTFSGNGVDNFGNGIANFGTLAVTNGTFTDNSGVSIGNYGNSTAVLRNTIVAHTRNGLPGSGNCSGITDGGHNLDDGTSCGFSATNGSLSNTDPQLDPAGLQSNGGPTKTIAVLPTSPAIDAGDPAVCAAAPVNDLDQRGFVRPGAGHTHCSIGAYEADAAPEAVCSGDCDGMGSVTVDELITLVNIALGNSPPSACPDGVPSGADVDVAMIIQAVNHALNGCGGGQ